MPKVKVVVTPDLKVYIANGTINIIHLLKIGDTIINMDLVTDIRLDRVTDARAPQERGTELTAEGGRGAFRDVGGPPAEV